MTCHYQIDGSVDLVDDVDPGRTLTIPAGATDRDAQIAAFFPPVVPEVSCVTGRQIIGQVKAMGIGAAVLAFLAAPTTAAQMPSSVIYWNAIGMNVLVPIDNAKVSNILTGAGVSDVPNFMAAALLLQA